MPEPVSMGTVWLVLDLAGTAVFAISGAATGVKYRLDTFGVCVLAFVAGNAGGMLRDVLLGATPPAVLSGWHHVTVSLLAALLTFWWHPRVERLRTPILLFDAAGLGLFAVKDCRCQVLVESGKQYALYFHGSPGEEVTLELPKGEYAAEWINIITGKTIRQFSPESAGPETKFPAPLNQAELALRIHSR